MSLDHITLTKLVRTEYNGDIEITQRKENNANDGVIYSLFEQAKQQFNRSSAKRFGFFDDASEHKHIIGLVENWQSEKMPFLSLANKLGIALQHQLDGSETPFKCHLLFAEESILGQHYLYVFWLPLTDIIQIGKDLEPETAEMVDASKLQYGLRLHLDEWSSGDSPKYLTQLASRGSKDLAEAFKRFSNFSEGIDLNRQTSEFLEIVDSYSEELPEEKSNAFKTQVLDYCVEQDKVGNPVRLEEISEQINTEEPKAFAAFVNAKQENPQSEIYTDRQSLKRYMRYFGRDHSLSISFSAERFGKDIKYDPASSSLRIEKLPKNLKIQLSGFTEKA